MDQIKDLQDRLAKAEDRARKAENRASMLKLEVERLRQPQVAAAAVANDPAAQAGKFTAVKRAFARYYHPNNDHGSAFESGVRAQVFNEFWPEIERIEQSGG